MTWFNAIRGAARLTAIAAAAMITLASQAHAQVTAATGVPSSIRINAVSAHSVSVTWRVEAVVTIPTVISSTSGTIFVGGVPIATVGGTLARTRSTPSTLIFRETIPISAAVARRIREGGVVTYERTFTPELAAGIGLASITVIPTFAGDLAIRDIDVFFDDDSQYRIVSRGDQVTARAAISSIGSGILEGRWEHAGPGGISAGNVAFQPLRRVRQALGGSRRLTLTSPQLPTNIAGLHILRFRPLRLDQRSILINESLVELRYLVRESADGETIALIEPAETVPLTPSTQFVWRPAAGAAHHRLEFVGDGTAPVGLDDARLAAVDLPGTGNSVRLRPFTLHRLAGTRGRIYWRIVAYDGAGHPIAQSALRRLRRTPLAIPADR